MTVIRCMRGRAGAQSYIHARLWHLGCAFICAVMRQILGTPQLRLVLTLRVAYDVAQCTLSHLISFNLLR